MADDSSEKTISQPKGLVSGFALNNPAHSQWLAVFLAGLQEALFKENKLVENLKIPVWFNSKPSWIILTTTNAERDPDDAARDEKSLFPTDIVNLIVDLAKNLGVPHKSTDQYLLNVERTSNQAEGLEDIILEESVLDPQTTFELKTLVDKISEKLKKATQQAEKKAEEAEQPTTPAAAEPAQPVAPPQREVATAGVRPIPTEGGDRGETQAEPAVAVATSADISAQAAARTKRYEFAWIYNHFLFDLTGKYGIEPSELLKAKLQGIVSEHLSTISPEELSSFFANPTARLRAVQAIYQKLNLRDDFKQTLGNQYDSYLLTATESQKQQFLQSNNFAKSGLQIIENLQNFQLENNQSGVIKQAESALAGLTGTAIDGPTALNFERAIEALALTMGSKSVAQDLGLSYPTDKADLEIFIKKLTAEQIAQIFFPNPNKPDEVDGKILAAIEQNLEAIQNLLTATLLATSLEKLAKAPEELRRLIGIADVTTTQLSADNDQLITSIRTLTGALPVAGKDEDVTTAITTSHTQQLMEQYQKRVQKIWASLEEESQLRAYYKLYNLTENDANRKVLLDKIQHLRLPDSGKLPWNPNLINLINWEDFLLKDFKANQRAMALRAKAAEGFTKNLSQLQLEQLQISHLLNELENGVVYAEGVAHKINQNEDVVDLEFRSVLNTLDLVTTRLDLLKSRKLAEGDEKFNEALNERVSNLSGRCTTVLSTLASYNRLAGLLQNYQNLTLVETYQLTLEYEIPEILLYQIGDITQPGFNPQAELADGVTANTLLDDPSSLSLAQLNRATSTQNQMGKNGRHRIAGPQQNNQALEDAKALATDVGQLAIQSKGNLLAAAGLGVKRYFEDKEFQKRVNRVFFKAAQIALGGFIAGTAIVQLLLRNLIGMVGPWGGAIGGGLAGAGLGFVVGGPFGALIGGIAGGIGGWLAGQKLAAFNAANGAELIPASSSQFVSTSPAAQPIFHEEVLSSSPSTFQTPASGTGLEATTPAVSTTSPLAPVASTSVVAQTPFLGSLAGVPVLALIPALSMLSLASITVYTLFVIFSAFLAPLPIGNLSGINTTKSEYAVLTKLATPSTLANSTSANVNYKIILQPRRNFQLKVTAVTDSANTGFSFQSNRSGKINPQVSPPASLLNPRISLADFSPDFYGQTQLKEYSVTFSGGKDVLVSNVIKITYDVQDSQGNSVATNQTLEATANVSIGDHGVFCWPTTGEIVQLPGGSFSHGDSDAFDISAPRGNKIYTPFAGWAQKGDMGNSDYGKYVVVDSLVQGKWIRIIYAHLNSTAVGTPTSHAWFNVAVNHDSDEGNNVGQPVGAGQLIGNVGSTGRSTGPHLHYELTHIDRRRHTLGGGFNLLNLVPPKPTGGRYKVGDYVKTCYPFN